MHDWTARDLLKPSLLGYGGLCRCIKSIISQKQYQQFILKTLPLFYTAHSHDHSTYHANILVFLKPKISKNFPLKNIDAKHVNTDKV